MILMSQIHLKLNENHFLRLLGATKKIQKKVIAFFDLNFLELIAQTLSGVWKWYLGWLKIHMWALWELADFAEISADFDPYILVIFFEKS